MDFKDWRNSPTRPAVGDEIPHKHRGRRFSDYIEEQIRAAEERGDFRNLRGMGQPLNLDVNPYAGEKSLGYSLLKSNGYAPPEVELAREISQELERLEAQRAALSRRGRELRHRPLPLFTSEKRAYNTAVNKALAEYGEALGELNRKILTLNLSTPASMHRPSLNVEQMISQFREACPLFAC
jgi:DnaJ family protein C protein 28